MGNRGRALYDFVVRLADGDFVTWCIFSGLLVSGVILAVIVWLVNVSRKREDEVRAKQYGRE